MHIHNGSKCYLDFILLMFLTHVHVLMLCSKFEVIPIEFNFFINF